MAEEFGYQVSPGPASAMTPTVGAVVSEELDKAKSEKSEIPLGLTGTALVIAVLLNPLWYQDDPPLIGVLLPLALSILGVIWSVHEDTRIKGNVQAMERKAAVALASPWQAWPCRLEELPGGKGKGMMLLGPDTTVVCTFSSPVPESVWVGTPDGRGVFWFAGDLRFGGPMSVPGGDPLWWAHPVPIPTTLAPAGRRQETLEEAVIHQAVGFAFEEWL
ncbi:hypothetical protein AB0932_35975 [Streptomyces sp. NPDC006682]|uniref:hypothetical protein n=1 Tax=unclassified Streptomyces TaxID=2593676 RepID=UPI00299FC678|nr:MULTISPECIES: hypothetical protein [unclassified Streptomyces]MDX3186479.1 hypothetical protein [Streptomyces sp. ME02-7008A-1]MDX3307116.1 hypothetical protein [Streptomyces sp. ME02-7008A]